MMMWHLQIWWSIRLPFLLHNRIHQLLELQPWSLPLFEAFTVSWTPYVHRFTGAYLSNANYLAIWTPSCLFQILWNLCGLARTSLSDNDEDWKCLDKIEKTLSMSSNGEEWWRFVKRRNEVWGQVKIGHFVTRAYWHQARVVATMSVTLLPSPCVVLLKLFCQVMSA